MKNKDAKSNGLPSMQRPRFLCVGNKFEIEKPYVGGQWKEARCSGGQQREKERNDSVIAIANNSK